MSVAMCNCHCWPLDVSNYLSGYFIWNLVLVTSCVSMGGSSACHSHRQHWTVKSSLCALAVLTRGAICLWYLYIYICTGISLYFLISWLFWMGSHWWHWKAKSSLCALAVLNGGSIISFTWLNLKIWAHLPFHTLLHRRSFCITYERPNNYTNISMYNTKYETNKNENIHWPIYHIIITIQSIIYLFISLVYIYVKDYASYL